MTLPVIEVGLSYLSKYTFIMLENSLAVIKLFRICEARTGNNYSKIPILRPPLGLSKSGLKDHFWTVPKVVSNQVYTGCRK